MMMILFVKKLKQQKNNSLLPNKLYDINQSQVSKGEAENSYSL